MKTFQSDSHANRKLSKNGNYYTFEAWPKKQPFKAKRSYKHPVTYNKNYKFTLTLNNWVGWLCFALAELFMILYFWG